MTEREQLEVANAHLLRRRLDRPSGTLVGTKGSDLIRTVISVQ